MSFIYFCVHFLPVCVVVAVVSSFLSLFEELRCVIEVPTSVKILSSLILNLLMVSSQGHVCQTNMISLFTVFSLFSCFLVETQTTRVTRQLLTSGLCTAPESIKAEMLALGFGRRGLLATWSAACITLLTDMMQLSSLQMNTSGMRSPAFFFSSVLLSYGVHVSQKPCCSTQMLQQPPHLAVLLLQVAQDHLLFSSQKVLFPFLIAFIPPRKSVCMFHNPLQSMSSAN